MGTVVPLLGSLLLKCSVEGHSGVALEGTGPRSPLPRRGLGGYTRDMPIQRSRVVRRPGQDMTAEEFLGHAYGNFARAAEKWLTGSEPFTAKLNPAYAPYGDYDQLMRLEEWYGRR